MFLVALRMFLMILAEAKVDKGPSDYGKASK